MASFPERAAKFRATLRALKKANFALNLLPIDRVSDINHHCCFLKSLHFTWWSAELTVTAFTFQARDGTRSRYIHVLFCDLAGYATPTLRQTHRYLDDLRAVLMDGLMKKRFGWSPVPRVTADYDQGS